MKNILAVCVGAAIALARDERLSVSSLLRRTEHDGSELSPPGRTDCALQSGVPSAMLTQLYAGPQHPEVRLVWMESPAGIPYVVVQLSLSGWRHEVLLPLASLSVRQWLMELRMQSEMCLLLSSRQAGGGSFLRVPVGRRDFPEEVWAGIWRQPKKSQLKSYFEAAVIFAAGRALCGGHAGETVSGAMWQHSVSILVPDELEIDSFDGLREALPSL